MTVKLIIFYISLVSFLSVCPSYLTWCYPSNYGIAIMTLLTSVKQSGTGFKGNFEQFGAYKKTMQISNTE